MSATDLLSGIAVRQSARSACAALAEADLLTWSRMIELPEGPAAVMDCLRRLGCIADWWPGATSVRPLAGGLCQPGDVGLLETEAEALLLRVLAFRPRRLVLALAGRRTLTVVDVALRTAGEGCEVTLRFERPAPGWPVADQWAARRLSAFGSKAAARMEWHLRQRAVSADDKVR
jgi:hypothetical protein